MFFINFRFLLVENIKLKFLLDSPKSLTNSQNHSCKDLQEACSSFQVPASCDSENCPKAMQPVEWHVRVHWEKLTNERDEKSDRILLQFSLQLLELHVRGVFIEASRNFIFIFL